MAKMTAQKFTRWREKNFPADTDKKSREALAKVWGVSARTIEGYEYGRPIPGFIEYLMKHKTKKTT